MPPRRDNKPGRDMPGASMVAFSLWIGNHFIAAGHGACIRADVMELALRRLAA